MTLGWVLSGLGRIIGSRWRLVAMIAGHAAAGPLDGSLPADVAAALAAARAKSDALREDDPFRAEFHTVLAAAEAAL